MNETNAPAPMMFDKAIALVLDVSCLGNSRKVPTSKITVDADEDSINATKKLLDAPEYKAITQLDSAVGSYLKTRCLPSLFKNGVYLLPIALLEEVDAKLREFQAQREALVEMFVAVYPALIEAAPGRLRAVFNPTDYPSPEAVAKKFNLSWRYVTFGVPEQLGEVSTELWKREQDKAKKLWAEAQTEIQAVLRANAAELVDHLLDRLTPGPDGAVKTFKASSLGNVKEFVELFEARNITNDAELAELLDKARQLLNGVNAETLRNSANVKNAVREGFTEIKAKLDEMVISGGRMISFED